MLFAVRVRLPTMNGDAPSTVAAFTRACTMERKIGRHVERPSSDDGTVQPPLSSPLFRERWPQLFSFLVNHRGSGQNASTGTLTLFLEQGCFKLCLNDRPNLRSTFVSGKSLTAAFDAADVGMASGRLKWRQKGYQAPETRQKSFLQA